MWSKMLISTLTLDHGHVLEMDNRQICARARPNTKPRQTHDAVFVLADDDAGRNFGSWFFLAAKPEAHVMVRAHSSTQLIQLPRCVSAASQRGLGVHGGVFVLESTIHTRPVIKQLVSRACHELLPFCMRTTFIWSSRQPCFFSDPSMITNDT